MDDLLADFLTETNESLAELDVALVTLERTPDDADTLSVIFRLVHTIKGTCGFLGLPRLERVAHAAENVLGRLRDETLTVTPEIVSQILAALDRIKAIVAALGATGAEPAGDDSALIAALNATAANDAPPSGPAGAATGTSHAWPARPAGRQPRRSPDPTSFRDGCRRAAAATPGRPRARRAPAPPVAERPRRKPPRPRRPLPRSRAC